MNKIGLKIFLFDKFFALEIIDIVSCWSGGLWITVTDSGGWKYQVYNADLYFNIWLGCWLMKQMVA